MMRDSLTALSPVAAGAPTARQFYAGYAHAARFETDIPMSEIIPRCSLIRPVISLKFRYPFYKMDVGALTSLYWVHLPPVPGSH